MTVLAAGSQPPVVAYPDELGHDAMYRMLQRDIGRLPVVSRENPAQMVGYFNRSSVLGAWTRQMQEESVREHGWVRLWRASSRAPKRTPQVPKNEFRIRRHRRRRSHRRTRLLRQIPSRRNCAALKPSRCRHARTSR